MKEEVVDWFHSCNKKEAFFWVQFILFFLSNINTHGENVIKASILAMYVLGLLYMVYKNPDFKRPPTYLIVIFGLYLILNAIFIKSFSVHIIYCVITFIMIRGLRFNNKELLSIINKSAIVYLILSVLLSYTPLRVLSIYDTRLVVNRFFPDLLYRFIGVEGSPAGPDIFYVLVLISNIVINKKRNKYFYITMSLLMLVWTSSLAPILSIVGALIILPFSKSKISKTVYSVLLWLYEFIVIFIYSYGSGTIRNLLNTASTLRARIWYNMYYSLIGHSTFLQWIFGRKGLVNFEHSPHYNINNPHNYSLFLIQFGGIIAFIIIVVIATIYFKNIRNKYKLFIVSAILIYASTNTFILSIRGNPIFIFVLVTYLASGDEPEKDFIGNYK
ncbi:hypothetical protein LGK95_10670 [Clostridium algoriphilum]|uniref:hypothetical protein n=1 Tax=Clostridium algoriphilum TaxID=198347 RepID=UPI001CF27889|nr:hypothetical protein [Clostridium algoriphilum]MCB2293981.1 hypothetical protein [Clostridium algoriphilum]